MPTRTRSQHQAEVKHVLEELLQLPVDSALHRVVAENGYDYMDDLLAEPDATLRTLTYRQD